VRGERREGKGYEIGRDVRNVGHDPNRIPRSLFGSFAIRESVQRVSKSIKRVLKEAAT